MTMFLWSPLPTIRRFWFYHGTCSRIATCIDITLDGQMVCYDQGAERKILGCDLCPFKFSVYHFQLAINIGQQHRETTHQWQTAI